MGNAATKEARPSHGPHPRLTHTRGSSNVSANNGSHDHQHHGLEGGSSSRHRGSRADFSFFGISTAVDNEQPTVEQRRETRQEREARRLERERVARIKERERSMKEEHVDGGYVVTQGVYVGTEDFSKAVVRQLMIERRLAPFWRGLNDFSDSWAEHQLMAAARGLPIPAADEVPPELEYKIAPKSTDERSAIESSLNTLMVPISSRSQSYNSDTSSGTHPLSPSSLSPSVPQSPNSTGSPSGNLFRSRAKTLASLTTSSKTNMQADMSPREIKLPRDPFVNGQPIEVYLYKDASECPICFLYYPPYLNKTRCCDQPICSECFVQIKRPDPHPPEHETNAPSQTGSERANQQDGQLVSEPAACPFCVQPEFGVSYAPPPFRRGLTYIANQGLRGLGNTGSPASSTSSLASGNTGSQGPTGRRRATSLSANAPNVIATDKIRPDWAQKLATARAHAARRAAAATALHTAAYLMNNNGESRTFGNVGRRGIMRRATGQGSESPTGRTNSPHLNVLASFTERRPPSGRDIETPEEGAAQNTSPHLGSRRTRMEELEEMMMLEAIRLSLASEEDRRRKEEKEARKEAKRRDKEAKKAEKYARRNGLYSNNPSSAALDAPSSSTLSLPTNNSSVSVADTGKGKEVDRSTPPPATTSSEPPKLSLGRLDDGHPSSPLFPPSPVEPTKRSHLRHVSSASSSSSSLVESTSGEHIGSGSGGSGSSEPMFNFRSLAEVIGDEDKDSNSIEHIEHTKHNNSQPLTADAGSSQAEPQTTSTPEPSVPASEGGPSQQPQSEDERLERKELQTATVSAVTSRTPDVETTS
ncbi:hypothetical protein AJ80_04365 [Polytolypa hystricis UAMH7299]|uniref:Protein SIP5 n=1 Tax=Polytolypa hystricis (strain UAMH7299) TaxID=1447883 RepID=A0A2B7YCW8_POLH7|nr:hypothetical protein AJ80_04365 [Polytolypa hystricis UAMH7299]